MGYEILRAVKFVCDRCGASIISTTETKPRGYVDKWVDVADAHLPVGWIDLRNIGYFCGPVCAGQKREEIDRNEICPECGYRFQGAYDVRHAAGGHIGKSYPGERIIAVLSC